MDEKSNINEVNPQKHNYLMKWMSKIHLVSMNLRHVTEDEEEMEDGNTGSQIDTPAPATANQFQWQQTPAKQKFYLNPV